MGLGYPSHLVVEAEAILLPGLAVISIIDDSVSFVPPSLYRLSLT